MTELFIEKRFDEWINLKETIHTKNILQKFNEGEIWWAATGENVGIEINGKNSEFSRPVIIYKKFSRCGFLAIPLTSQQHENRWYIEFDFKDRKQYAVLSQIRVLSSARLYKRMGRMTEADFKKMKIGFRKMYC